MNTNTEEEDYIAMWRYSIYVPLCILCEGAPVIHPGSCIVSGDVTFNLLINPVNLLVAVYRSR